MNGTRETKGATTFSDTDQAVLILRNLRKRIRIRIIRIDNYCIALFFMKKLMNSAWNELHSLWMRHQFIHDHNGPKVANPASFSKGTTAKGYGFRSRGIRVCQNHSVPFMPTDGQANTHRKIHLVLTWHSFISGKHFFGHSV